jgi:glycosyltransferase involved in cell wall biosynthesis
LLPYGLNIWRKIGKHLNNLSLQLVNLKTDYAIYPGGDNVSYEIDIPCIVPIFDLMHRYEPNFPEVSSKTTYEYREHKYKMICKYSKAILADSELGKKHIIESYSVEKDKVFVLPFVAPSYLTNLKNIINIKAKYRLPERFIFYPAQYWAHKNHTNLLKAIKLLRDKRITVNAVFVGSKKNYYYKIKSLITYLDLSSQIWMLDYVNNIELIYLYKHAVALLIPSYFGPTNIPPLEAFALGCPVITSKVYGIPQQVTNAAILIDPKNEIEIANSIERLYLDKLLRKQLIQAGYEHHKKWNQEYFNRRLNDIVELIIK